MNASKLITVAAKLKHALHEPTITQLGRAVGFTRRLREVTPHRLALSLISALAAQRVETIADILRAFNALTGATVQYKPFHNQLAKNAFPRFMQGVFGRLLEETTLRVLEPVPDESLAQFDDIVIQDGSSFGLRAGLRTVFPGRFTTQAPAAVELHATMSVLRDQPVRVALAPDVQGERDFLPDAGELRRKLLLADRGYADLAYCRRVAEQEGHFIVRFKCDINPTVTKAWVTGRRRRRLEGQRFKAVTRRWRQPVDLDVQWNRRGEPPISLRLVVAWSPTTQEHIILATNLARRPFSPATILRVYRLRWQVELLFKEWKSYANLHAFGTEKAPIAEGLIWAALAAALVKRFLAHAVDFVCSATTTSTRRAAMALQHHLPHLFQALLRGRGVIHRLRELLAYLEANGQRAHPKRDRSQGRLGAGLYHALSGHTGG